MSLPTQSSPDLNPGGSPDYTYLDDQAPVSRQMLGHDAYVFDPSPEDTVIPLLDESDGLRIGIDGKLHVSSAEPVSDAELHAVTGAYRAREVHHPETEVVEPMSVAPATFAVHGLATSALYRSGYSAGNAGYKSRHRR